VEEDEAMRVDEKQYFDGMEKHKFLRKEVKKNEDGSHRSSARSNDK
jgi:hypothetical protein